MKWHEKNRFQRLATDSVEAPPSRRYYLPQRPKPSHDEPSCVSFVYLKQKNRPFGA